MKMATQLNYICKKQRKYIMICEKVKYIGFQCELFSRSESKSCDQLNWIRTSENCTSQSDCEI